MATSSAASAANNFSRVATLPNKTPISIRAWVRRNADRGNYSGFAALNKLGDELMYCGTDVDGETLLAYAGSTGGGPTGNTAVSDSLWHHIVYTYDGVDVKVYVDGSLVYTGATAQDAAAAISFTLLTTNFGSWWDGDIEAVAVWEQTLDAAEVLADMSYLEQQMTTDLWAFWPLSTGVDITDASGNRRDLTIVGTPTTVAGSGTPYAPPAPGVGDYRGFFARAY